MPAPGGVANLVTGLLRTAVEPHLKRWARICGDRGAVTPEAAARDVDTDLAHQLLVFTANRRGVRLPRWITVVLVVGGLFTVWQAVGLVVGLPALGAS
jgi:hypothetical protein